LLEAAESYFLMSCAATPYCIVFIHFYSTPFSMSHSEALLTAAFILCRS